MIILSKKPFFTGGKGRIRVWQAIGGDVDEHLRLVAAVQGVDKALWWGVWPTAEQPWPHNSKLLPVVSVKLELALALVDLHHAFEVPHSYFRLMTAILLRDQWREFTDHSQRERDGVAEAHFRAKIQWAAGQVRKCGEYVEEPDFYEPDLYCEPENLIPGLKTINSLIDNFDRGHRLRLNPAVVADEPDEIPPSVKEYLALDPDARKQFLQDRPWVRPVLVGRGLEAELPAE